jgi:hypothetical protein
MTGKELLPLLRNRPADRYSKNLYNWVKKHAGHCDLVVAYSQRQLGHAFTYAETAASCMYIGFGDLDDYWLHGSRLSTIICEGGHASSWAYPPAEDFKVIPDWWQNYLERGKCCIDPEHNLYWDVDRFEDNEGTLRACRWCGLTQRKRTWIEQVERVVWETIEQEAAA